MSDRESLWGDNSPIKRYRLFSMTVAFVFIMVNIGSIFLTNHPGFYIGLGGSVILLSVLALLYKFKPESHVFFIKYLLLFLSLSLISLFVLANYNALEEYRPQNINDTVEKYSSLVPWASADVEAASFTSDSCPEPQKHIQDSYVGERKFQLFVARCLPLVEPLPADHVPCDEIRRLVEGKKIPGDQLGLYGEWCG